MIHSCVVLKAGNMLLVLIKDFLNHQNSQSHKLAEINYKQCISRTSSATTVLQVMDKSRNELIKRNREKLIKIASTLCLCGRQMIATRGHEENES